MRKAIIFILLAFLLMFGATPVYANGIPPLPHAFYGDVTINESPAPRGTTIEASGAGVLTEIESNPVITTELGKYGSTASPELDLIVQGDIGDGATISFYVNGALANETAEWHSGETTDLPLSVTIPPTIGYSPSSFSFAAIAGGANPASQTLSISNSGVNPTAMDWSVADAADWLSLSPASGSSSEEVDSVTVSVSISGMSAGDYSATITISAPEVTNSPQTVPVSLHISTEPEPNISVSPMSKNFGNVTVGSSSSPQTFTMSNVGTATLTITDITISGPSSEEFSMSPYPDTIPAGDSAGVNVTFSPTSIGSKSATLAVTSNDPDEATVEVSLSGTGVAAPALAVTTSAATSVTTSRATLRGNLSNLGTALSVEVSFEWGTTTAYGAETATQTMTATGSFSFSLTGLSDDTTYHFQAKAVGDGTSYGADRTFTTSDKPTAAAPPPLPPGTTDVRGLVSTDGVFEESTTAISDDELCTLDIPEGTVGLTEELEPLAEISMEIMDEPPDPPKDAHVIGLAYDFGPDGATFDPPITLEYSYDPADIPEGIAEEDLVIAYYDEAIGEWVELEGCVVDTENNTITAPISHFTTFAVIAVPVEEEIVLPSPPIYVPAPAAFSLTDLSVTPVEVLTGEAVTITVPVANTGGTEGSYTVVLKINEVKEADKSVTIAAGSSEMVTFSVTREKVGSYTVTVDGLSASFAVVAVAEVEEVEKVLVPAKPPGVNWPLIGGLIAAVVIAGLFVFVWLKRRAYP